MNRKQIKVLAISLVLLAFAISFEQYISWGSFFELKDVLHHEYIITITVFTALLLMAYSKGRKK